MPFPPAGNYLEHLQDAIADLPLDSFFLFAQASTDLALVDLVNPSRTATVSGAPVFTPFRGYKGDGFDDYININYNPSTDAVHFSQNSNSFGIWSRTNEADPSGGWDFGQVNFAIAPFGTSQRDIFTRCAAAASNSVQYYAQAGNLYGANRKTSAGYSLFQNDARLVLGYTSASNSGNIKTGLHGQGWCTDGAYYYIFEQDAIRKRSRSDWSILASNTSVFTGLSGSPNHFGDGDIYGDYLYVPVELYAGSCSTASSDLQIARYKLSDLQLQDTHVVTGPSELGGLCIDSGRGVIYATSYCDNTQIYRYDLNTFERLTSIPLHTNRDFNFGGIQGIAYRNNTLWITCTKVQGTSPNRFVVNIDLNGKVLCIISVSESSAQLEGVNFDADGKMGVMQDDGGTNQYIYFYNLPSEDSVSYTQASAAIPSASFNVFRRSDVLTYTPNQIAAVFTGGGMSDAEWKSFYNALYTYLKSVGAA